MNNIERVLNIIRDGRGLSRADIARGSGLSKPFVSAVVDKLISGGFVLETGKGEASRGGGKRPTCLSLNAAEFGAIGIDVGRGGMALSGVLYDGMLNEVNHASVDFENRFEAICAAIVELTGKLLSGNRRIKVKGIGIAVSGIVDGNEIVLSSNFDLTGRNLAGEVEKQTGLPVFVSNRARLAALAEFEQGCACGCPDFLYLSIGRSVGGVIYSGGKLFPGADGRAGELRSYPLAYGEVGKVKVGTLEELVSESALLAEIAAVTGEEIDFEEVVRRYEARDICCRRSVERNARLLGQAATHLVRVLDLPLIIIGGEARRFGDDYIAGFVRGMREAWPESEQIQVEASKFGAAGTALGAAMTIVRKSLMNVSEAE